MEQDQLKAYWIERLRSEYRADPTGQATAFWKMENWINDEATIILESLGTTSIIQSSRLLLRQPMNSSFEKSIDSNLDLMVYACKQNDLIGYGEKRFFKLYHDHSDLKPLKNDNVFTFSTVQNGEAGEVASFINRNYANIRVNKEAVESWFSRQVYEQDLWIWVENPLTGERLGLGIAELDSNIGEGALEWIQVEQLHRGKGIGKMLVFELLDRISKKAKFTTVSGDKDNESSPEQLYRSCGFKGDRVWHIYNRL